MLKLKSLLKMKDMDKGEKKSNLSKHTIKVLVGFSVALVMGIYTNVGIHPSDQVGASLNVDAATITAPAMLMLLMKWIRSRKMKLPNRLVMRITTICAALWNQNLVTAM